MLKPRRTRRSSRARWWTWFEPGVTHRLAREFESTDRRRRHESLGYLDLVELEMLNDPSSTLDLARHERSRGTLLLEALRAPSAAQPPPSHDKTESNKLRPDDRLGEGSARWLINGYSRAKPTTTAIAL
jgi:hypothetical protein